MRLTAPIAPICLGENSFLQKTINTNAGINRQNAVPTTNSFCFGFNGSLFILRLPSGQATLLRGSAGA